MSDEQAVRPLLTIAIPTYNRQSSLALLLGSLVEQIEHAALSRFVDVLIVDNCSTDGTATYIQGMRNHYIDTVTHSQNHGADYNVRYCFDAARGRFVWVIGDDDLPRLGSVNAVVNHLRGADPDLLFLPAWGYDCELTRFRHEGIPSSAIKTVSRERFSVRAGVHLTFLSAIVANKDRYEALRGRYQIERCAMTSLPQLEWVLSLLAGGDRFSTAEGVWIVGRAGNSGGYDRFRTFGTTYVRLVSSLLAARPQLANFLIGDMLYSLLPSIVYSGKRQRAGDFANHDSREAEAVLLEAFPQHRWFNRLLMRRLFAAGRLSTWLLLAMSVVVSRANKLRFLVGAARAARTTGTSAHRTCR